MIVTRSNFTEVVGLLSRKNPLSVDTETTGLRMYHGDKIFSIIISDGTEAWYFNFWTYDKDPSFPGEEALLGDYHLQRLSFVLFEDPSRLWFMHNAANFDVPMLERSKVHLLGIIHCTKAIARIERNDHYSYDLASCLERIGEAKDETVAEYITKQGLFEKVKIEGKKTQERIEFYYKVPFSMIEPYGEKDALGTFKLGMHQRKTIKEKDSLQPDMVTKGRTLEKVMHNEIRLQRTVFNMKSRGVLIDREYCKKAIAYETDRQEKASAEFKRETGKDFSASSKLFLDVFASDKDLWKYTEKQNASFTSDILQHFKNPLAKTVLTLRDAKSKADFYHGFIYHADKYGILHPNFNPEGTVHGRFSSSNPNFQNLTSEEDEEQVEQEFVVRRAIIPRPGFIYIMPDYDQMEYRFILELASLLLGYETNLTKMVNGGLDVHSATIKAVYDYSKKEIPRKHAKVSNFLSIYGGGPQALADNLGISFKEAKSIRQTIFSAAPELSETIEAISNTARKQGYVTNWFGRRSYFAYKSMSYKATNYVVSGGCADIVKVAMNRVDEYLKNKKSAMTMTIHDETPIEVHESEIEEVPRKIKEIMETVYVGKFLKLTTGMEYSARSLGDKIKGMPK